MCLDQDSEVFLGFGKILRIKFHLIFLSKGDQIIEHRIADLEILVVVLHRYLGEVTLVFAHIVQ